MTEERGRNSGDNANEDMEFEASGFAIVERAQFVRAGQDDLVYYSPEDLEGRTIEELAQIGNPEIDGVLTYKVVTGEVRMGDEVFELESRPFAISGITFFDGAVYTLQEASRHLPPGVRITSVVPIDEGVTNVIMTRNNRWAPFGLNDRVIEMGPANQLPSADPTNP